MAKRGNAASGESVSHVPIVANFDVGSHRVCVTKMMEGRWTVAVDGAGNPDSFRSQADAWEAGVREADRLDKAALA